MEPNVLKRNQLHIYQNHHFGIVLIQKIFCIKHKDINSIYDLDESNTIYKLLPEKEYDYNIGR
jgi:hypothetical protein